MTIEQFLEEQKLDSNTQLRFRFTDRQGVDWSYEDSSTSCLLKCSHILKFPCNLKYNEGNSYTFDLDLNKIPTDIFTTFSEIYEQPAKKSEGEKITVREYLQNLQNGDSNESQLKVVFHQMVYILPSDEFWGWCRFSTQDAVSLENAINGPFSHLFVGNVTREDGTIFVELATDAEEKTKKRREAKIDRIRKRIEKKYHVVDIIGSAIGGCIGLAIGGCIGGTFAAEMIGLGSGAAISQILSFCIFNTLYLKAVGFR